MKRFLFLFISLVLFCNPFSVKADEGMWLPVLLEQLNINDMKARGFMLSADDIYSVNKTSMKDAVCQFGGGCTAELISGKGLLLTNHHCGFGYIQSHSSVEHDYLTNGFWAMDRSQELPCLGLTVTFIVSMEEVTNEVLSVVKDNMSESDRNTAINNKMKEMEKARSKDGQDAMVRSFYYGNVFYLFMTETYKDVRMVGAPPMAMGNFGGDTDNWMWPRHTADFSLFRIYAGKDNKPAEYSKDNVPYTPKKFFPINAKGVKEGDFTMVYGFPGRTTEYLSSFGVDLIATHSDPVKVDLRTIRLGIMWEEMMKSDKVRIQYAAKRNGAANAWKKWQGEMKGLRESGAVAKKKQYEADFMNRVLKNESWNDQYSSLLADLEKQHQAILPWQVSVDYMNEGILSVELVRYAYGFKKLLDASKAPVPDQKEIDKQLTELRSSMEGYFKDYDQNVDKRIAAAVLEAMDKGMIQDKKPAVLGVISKKYKGNYMKYAESVFGKSVFVNKDKVASLLNNYQASNWSKIANDPAWKLAEEVYGHFYKNLVPEFQKYNNEIGRLNRLYMKAQMEVFGNSKKFFPDANSTLRVAFGQISSFTGSNRDGYTYKWYTTIDGIIEKEDSLVPDYKVPVRLKQLYIKKDFGRYADKTTGKLHTCFIASNHTTGGNSGSPVIDAWGNLIGTNFDRVWEGTMSDINFDPERCRNIVLDVRYTLWVIDKYAGAGYLLDEMSIQW